MLRFACTAGRPEPYAAGPTLELDVRIAAEAGSRVHAVALRTQIRIEPRRRGYAADEAGRLGDLFGEPARWGETLNPLQLATLSTTVPGFTGSTTVRLPVPLTYDLDVAAAKYLHGLGPDGVVPLLLLFSGTVFAGPPDRVQVAMVPWHEEATFRLPVAAWRAAMDAHFPDSGWVRLRRDTLEALRAYRSERVLPTWDDAVERLLKESP